MVDKTLKDLVATFSQNQDGMYVKLVKYAVENRGRFTQRQFQKSLLEAGLTPSRASEVSRILKYPVVVKNFLKQHNPWNVRKALEVARAKHRKELEEQRSQANSTASSPVQSAGFEQSESPVIVPETEAEELTPDELEARAGRDEIVEVLDRIVDAMNANGRTSLECEIHL